MKLYYIKKVLVLLFVNFAFCCISQEKANISNHIEKESGGVITINQPKQLHDKLNKSNQVVVNNSSTEEDNGKIGYRIQVFSDNNQRTAKTMAQNRERQIAAEFPDLNVYLIYKSPSWRVRVGDFKTRGEAEQVMHEIRKKFPAYTSEITIVVDKINLIEK